MTEDDLHPTDVAAMRDSASHGGPLRQELSNAIVALFKQYYGRGPADCRTYLEPDLVVVVMTGGYHAAEQTLFEAGKWHEVRETRMSWQDTMQARFVETIEGLTRREVKGEAARATSVLRLPYRAAYPRDTVGSGAYPRESVT